MNDIENILRNNDEVGFLYEKCKKTKPSVISKLVFVPEYMDAIKEYDGYINDYILYDIIHTEFLKMLKEGTDHRIARDIMNKISRDVKGSSSAWQQK